VNFQLLNSTLLRQLVLLIVALLLGSPVSSYDFPLSSSAIRDAYFRGIRQADMQDFLAQYTRVVPEIQLGESLVTRAKIETPFLQVAVHAGKTLNYSAQDAVNDFYGKSAVLRLNLEIPYMANAPEPGSVKISVIQNRRQISPTSDDRSPFFPATDPYTRAIDVGEIVNMEFDPNKFDSSTLTIKIDTPDGQHAKTEFDLVSLR